MKIEKIIEDALNQQIRREFESAFSYLSIATDLGKTPYSGFAHWMKKQYEEELMHAMKIYEYILERQGCVELQNFKCNKYSVKTPLEAFKVSYDLEVETTNHIHDIYNLAVEKKDFPTQVFLQWFIDEQVEEESHCQNFIDKLTLANDCSCSLMALDHEAGKRED